ARSNALVFASTYEQMTSIVVVAIPHVDLLNDAKTASVYAPTQYATVRRVSISRWIRPTVEDAIFSAAMHKSVAMACVCRRIHY
ncbi:MAG TPA: hypothetical protein VM260_00250, partial [Pirellula sp.]|nr:hypothetical protein [Pirellula sp.]